MTPLREDLLAIVRERGLRHSDVPFKLASGEMSNWFLDGKRALAQGDDLVVACQAILELAAARGVEFDAVGGLTLGADQFAHGVAMVGHKDWFVVRKAPKGRGTNQLIEGAQLTPDSRVLLVDDVVTTGGSIKQAYDDVTRESGAKVVLAVTLVDRGERAKTYFRSIGVPYEPLLTYVDLGIPEVGVDPSRAAAAV